MVDVTQELKPCPFCGGEAKWIEYSEDMPFDEPFGLVSDHSSTCHFAGFLADTDHIIAAWNQRPAPDGEVVATYRHVKRGTTYAVIGEAELQVATWNLRDGSKMVVYRGEDGRLWVREYGEFHDGRFEYVEDTHPPRNDAAVEALREALAWHEDQDKAISKQPNANMGANGWRRLQHQEQAELLRSALKQGEPR